MASKPIRKQRLEAFWYIGSLARGIHTQYWPYAFVVIASVNNSRRLMLNTQDLVI
jgi:hypothetical protein